MNNTIELKDIIIISNNKIFNNIINYNTTFESLYAWIGDNTRHKLGKIYDTITIKKNYIKNIAMLNESISTFIIFNCAYNQKIIKYYDTNKEAYSAYKMYQQLI